MSQSRPDSGKCLHCCFDFQDVCRDTFDARLGQVWHSQHHKGGSGLTGKPAASSCLFPQFEIFGILSGDAQQTTPVLTELIEVDQPHRQ
jgi:hypothetical protein